MQYRRSNIKGGSYFFTVNLSNRQRTLLIDEINLLRMVIHKVKKQHPFEIDAIVILPEHLHALWTLPQGDNDYATRWMLIKSNFSRQLPKTEYRSTSRKNKGERGIWQRRYWEHLIKNEKDYEQPIHYIHYNPVKHGYVTRASAWQYSSIHRYIAKHLIDKNWGNQHNTLDHLSFGERE